MAMSPATTRLDQLCIGAIRALSIDAIQKANSGHPGLPLGAAPAAYALWSRHLKHNPANPAWPDRDRFVLSAGHGSALLYSLLHLTGYDVTLDDLKSFRQWDSRTPGHPEHGLTAGVETTTGPLGQGFATSVGMAIGERHLAARFNRPGHAIVDHFTYVLVGDGDMMEGVALEAASLAGHLGLGKLVCLYDSNRITLAAAADLSFTQNIGATFAACGWHVQTVTDGNDVEAVSMAIAVAKTVLDRPSLIVVETQIGFGSPKQGSCGVHGSPLSAEQVVETKKTLHYPTLEPFAVPEEALANCRQALANGKVREGEWTRAFETYAKAHPDLAREWRRVMTRELAAGWDADIPTFSPSDKPIATRTAGGKILNAIAARLPEIVGGSADLNPSTETALKGAGDFQNPAAAPDDRQGAVGGEWGFGGRNIHFGVREHAMGSIASGLALHGGLRPFTATFLTFADYMRPAMRLASLMGLPVTYVFTHDSIAVGEDGPTHQPVEHLAALRAIPKLAVLRPADANETAAAWRVAMTRSAGPVAILLTRQALPNLPVNPDAERGGYVVAESDGPPDLLLIATGSEVSLALEARQKLAGQGVKARVVSLLSWELFAEQSLDYQLHVLPSDVPVRLAIEAGVPMGWERFVGPFGGILAIEGRFGASAPLKIVMEKLGFSVENVVARAQQLLADYPERARRMMQTLAAGPGKPSR
jgi:transketolase